MTFIPIKLSLRQLSRQKLNTTLHIVGLTLAMSVCLLIGLFLRHELSFDAYHPFAERTFRVTSVWSDNGKKNFQYSTPLPLAAALRAQVPGLEHVTLAHPQDQVVIALTPLRVFKQDRILIVDPEFIDVFRIDVLKGNARKALSEPYQALLTEATAQKFYGSDDPMGKTFTYRNKYHITVAGVIRDLPGNTHLPASMLLSFVPDQGFLENNPEGWYTISGTETYVVVPPDYDLRKVDAPFKAIANGNINSEPGLPKDVRNDLLLQPLRKIHFEPEYNGGGNWVKAFNATWLWFFGSIGLAVLALACINFVNLSTAQAITRTKEIGIRKASGAGRNQLIAQFLREAWILAAIAGVISIAIVQVCLPAVNTLLGKEMAFGILQSGTLLLVLLGGIFVTGLLAGFYPAWVITKFNPSSSLKTGSNRRG